MRFCIGLSYYQNVQELKRFIDSIPSHIPVIAIDGRYSDFDAPNDFSNDGSTELLMQHSNVTLGFFTGPQWQKRQKYLDIAALLGYDFVFVIDSDEYIHPDYNDWNKFEKSLKRCAEKYPKEHAFYVKLFIDKDYEKAHNIVRRGQFKRYARLIREPATKKYDLEHHYLIAFKNDTNRNWLQAKHTIEGVRLAMDSKMRTREFLDKRNDWAYRQHLTENKKMARFVWDEMMIKAKATEIPQQ